MVDIHEGSIYDFLDEFNGSSNEEVIDAKEKEMLEIQHLLLDSQCGYSSSIGYQDFLDD